MSPSQKPMPLDGVRIIDITAVIGAPIGTGLLAQMGAEVIRVESTRIFPATTRGSLAHPPKEIVPSMGPVGRGYPDFEPGERPWNRFALFNCHGHNKLSMTVDLLLPDGVEIFHRLLQLTDVVIENVPGVMDKLGLGYEALRRVQPDIIMLSVSGMGSTGPYKDNRGFGGHFEDVMGHAWLRGYPDDHPGSNTSVVASDPAVGAGLAWAVAAALHSRRSTGKGQHIDMSMAEVYLHHLGTAFLDYEMNHRAERTLGNRHPFLAPHGCYPCKGEDKWVTIAVRDDREWESLRLAMGDPDWARDPKLADGYGRSRRQDLIDRQIEEWTRKHGHVELQKLLQEAGVPAGAVLDDSEIFQDPHLRERGFYKRVSHPEAGSHDYPYTFWHMSESPWESRRPPPTLGEHNEGLYQGLLGLSQGDYRRLEAQGHIGTAYEPHIR